MLNLETHFALLLSPKTDYQFIAFMPSVLSLFWDGNLTQMHFPSYAEIQNQNYESNESIPQ